MRLVDKYLGIQYVTEQTHVKVIFQGIKPPNFSHADGQCLQHFHFTKFTAKYIFAVIINHDKSVILFKG